MVDLFIYDSAHVPYKLQPDGTIPPGADLVKFREPIRLIETLPDYLLVRTLMDVDRGNFGGLQRFLSSILGNGHDRTDPDDFGKHLSPLEIKALKEKGYKGTDIFWAKPILRDSRPEPYDLANHDGCTTAYLVFDGRAYEELSFQVYGQRDKTIRRNALLAIIFFVREGRKPQIRDDMRFQFGLELDAQVIGQIQQKGYPT